MTHPLRGPKLEPEGLDDASLSIFRAFKRAMSGQRQLMMRLLAEKGSHPGQAGCLQILAAEDGMSQSALAAILHVSKPSVTTMLQKMERSGLVQRRPDSGDQRKTLIFVTAEGRRLHAEIRSVFSEVFEASVGPMPDSDKEELRRLLQTLADNTSAALEAHGKPAARQENEGDAE